MWNALHATRAAVEEGVVPGGGVALLRPLKGIANLKGSNDDQDVGINILRKSRRRAAAPVVGNAARMHPSCSMPSSTARVTTVSRRQRRSMATWSSSASSNRRR